MCTTPENDQPNAQSTKLITDKSLEALGNAFLSLTKLLYLKLDLKGYQL